MAAAEEDWNAIGEQIKKGTRKSMLEILEERGLVKDIPGYVPLSYTAYIADEACTALGAVSRI